MGDCAHYRKVVKSLLNSIWPPLNYGRVFKGLIDVDYFINTISEFSGQISNFKYSIFKKVLETWNLFNLRQILGPGNLIDVIPRNSKPNQTVIKTYIDSEYDIHSNKKKCCHQNY